MDNSIFADGNIYFPTDGYLASFEETAKSVRRDGRISGSYEVHGQRSREFYLHT